MIVFTDKKFNLKDFKQGIVKVLVATDIAARGIDIDNISHVINYELPNEPERYVQLIRNRFSGGTDTHLLWPA